MTLQVGPGGTAKPPLSGSHGIVVVDKPEGPTSHAIVGRARKAFDTRRVGHAGTLDPLATGVLVLGLGSATRLLGHLSGQGKEYVATIVLGVATVSDDAQGEVLSASGATVSAAEVEAAMQPWRGQVRQRPSAVSVFRSPQGPSGGQFGQLSSIPRSCRRSGFTEICSTRSEWAESQRPAPSSSYSFR